MRTILMLSAITATNRHAVMTIINDAIRGLGGWVEGHSLYGNMVTVFRFELNAARLPELEARLTAEAIHLDDKSIETLTTASTKPGECPFTLNMTFLHDEPDVKREVPAVPG